VAVVVLIWHPASTPDTTPRVNTRRVNTRGGNDDGPGLADGTNLAPGGSGMSNRRKPRRPLTPQERASAARLAAAAEAAGGDLSALYRQVQPTGNADPRRLGGTITGPGGPHDWGAVVLDMTDCVLLDSASVCLVDSVRDGRSNGQAIYMTMSGRVNKTDDRVQVGYTFGTDGAAALVTELLALADRAGPDLLTDIVARLVALDRDGNASIAWLRAALDLAQAGISDD